VQLRLRVPAGVPHDMRREDDRIVLLLGQAPAARPSPPPSGADLYRALFPAAQGDGGGLTPGIDPAAPENPGAPDRLAEPRREGIGLGSVTLHPSVMFDYVDADVSVLDTPETVRDRYAQARPSLTVDVPLRDGSLGVLYEARIRAYSAFDEVNGVSHRGEARLDYPVASRLRLRGQAHLARGVLETTEVDPGREYFFGLGQYTRKLFTAGARLETSSRFDFDVAGVIDDVKVDDTADFFDYQRRELQAGVGAEVGAGRRVSVSYGFEQVPSSAERPEAESRIHSMSAAVDGEIMPLLSGRATIGYVRRESPQAAPAGRAYDGLIFGAQLRRDFGRTAHLTVLGNRSTELSAFEENAFYVTTSFQAVLTATLPFSLALTAGGGHHVNQYQTVSREILAPRRDAITDWLVGIARTLSRWAFVRADYRHDRRDSNIDYFDQSTHAFYLELGVGFFTEATRP
jgi:hypothetical protein